MGIALATAASKRSVTPRAAANACRRGPWVAIRSLFGRDYVSTPVEGSFYELGRFIRSADAFDEDVDVWVVDDAPRVACEEMRV